MNSFVKMSPEDQLRYFPSHEQVYGVRKYVVDEGAARGASVYMVETGGGLRYELSATNALDVARLSYKGVNINYLSKNGDQKMLRPFENDFMNSFPAGMLYTCGLLSAGNSSRDDDGEYHPAHGRIHGQAADELCSGVDGDEVFVSGRVRETRLFGHCLTLRRRIHSKIGSNVLVIDDTLSNDTAQSAEYMILYHMNFGYPFLSEHLRLEVPEGTKTTPRTPFAAEGIDHFREFTRPVDGLEEQCFFHDLPTTNGVASLKLVNPELGLAATVSYTKDALPHVVEWKSMASGDYVLGIEPSNSFIFGRKGERENGTLRTLGAFESIHLRVSIAFEG